MWKPIGLSYWNCIPEIYICICSFINCVTFPLHSREDMVQKGSWVGPCSGSSGVQGHLSHFTVVVSWVCFLPT